MMAGGNKEQISKYNDNKERLNRKYLYFVSVVQNRATICIYRCHSNTDYKSTFVTQFQFN